MTEPVVDVAGTGVRLSVPARFRREVSRLTADLGRADRATREVAVAGSASGYSLVDDGVVVLTQVDPTVAPEAVVWRLSTIAAATTAHIVVHAAAVVDRATRHALVLAGVSGAGKSTLAAACITDGFDYLTDDRAAIELATGAVVPFARPLSLVGRGLVPATDIRPACVATPGVPAAVVFPRYSPDANATCVELDAADTLLALCANAVNLGLVGSDGFVALAAIATRCRSWQATYRTTDQALAVVRDVRSVMASAPRAHLRVLPPVTPTTTSVAIDDDVVVLDHDTGAVHRLNATSALVWSHVRGANDPTAIARAARRDGRAIGARAGDVEATVDRLVALGLVDRPS